MPKLELTKKELERQDFVDNKIHELLVELNPNKESDKESDKDWDIDVIGSIREVIRRLFVTKSICADHEFYPYVVTPEGFEERMLRVRDLPDYIQEYLYEDLKQYDFTGDEIWTFDSVTSHGEMNLDCVLRLERDKDDEYYLSIERDRVYDLNDDELENILYLLEREDESATHYR
jgi:hypothetical protein